MAVRIIAIDGPAASGKSSTGVRVAEHLGLAHIDSGSLYRAMTWLAITRGLTEGSEIAAAAATLPITLDRLGGELVVHAAGERLEAAIRAPEVTAQVSAVSARPEVREWVDQLLRRSVSDAGGAVVDGRDIGTVVFPTAPLKVFLTATPSARARRRLLQRSDTVDPLEEQAEAALLAERDRKDSTRAVAPLRPAADAVVVDTTELTLDDQVALILRLAASRGLSQG